MKKILISNKNKNLDFEYKYNKLIDSKTIIKKKNIFLILAECFVETVIEAINEEKENKPYLDSFAFSFHH
jgi:hypothetical protein